jgi:hypothetical protein
VIKHNKWRRFALAAVVTAILLFATVIIHDRHTIVGIEPPAPDPSWNAGPIVHLLPTVSHNRTLIKVSFSQPFTQAPRLEVEERSFTGQRMDSNGYFWCFDATDLRPSTRYEMRIQDASGNDLCDSWPLSTFPAPDARPDRLRLLIFTGLGGHDAHITWRGTGPLPLSTRRRLLKRALSLHPDALISSGDQIYYDLRYGKSPKYMGRSPESISYAGVFDPSLPTLGTNNEEVLKKAVGPQIAYLYGTACRSIPTFFLLDDHDYFENDEAIQKDGWNWIDLLVGWRSPIIEAGVSFPPDDFALDLGRSSQRLYLPEFLPDEKRPPDLPGSGAHDRPEGVSECYGTLRYGDLLEALLYESRRFTTLAGDDAVMIHPQAEQWLLDRMAAEEAIHVVNLPATIFGWSAGKWMEWYPDIRDEKGNLTTAKPKYLWQEGWFAQHNRILKAASSMKRCMPIFICGDIHCQAEGKILRSGGLDLAANPIIVVASGSLGTGPRGFPSGFRGAVAQPPTDLLVQEGLAALEKNGFVIAEFTRDRATIQFYAWKPPEPVEAIDTLKPHHTLSLTLK